MQKIKQDKLVATKLTTNTTAWYELLKNIMPHINSDILLKISEYCVRHQSMENKALEQSYIHLAARVLQKLAEAKIDFDIAKHPQKATDMKILLNFDIHDLSYSLTPSQLTDQLNDIIITSTINELVNLMKVNNVKQFSIYQLFSNVMLVDGIKGKEIHVTHKFI